MIQQLKGGFDDLFAIVHPYSQGKRSDFDTAMIFGTWVGKNQPWICFCT